jgi:hypothetical protein
MLEQLVKNSPYEVEVVAGWVVELEVKVVWKLAGSLVRGLVGSLLHVAG